MVCFSLISKTCFTPLVLTYAGRVSTVRWSCRVTLWQPVHGTCLAGPWVRCVPITKASIQHYFDLCVLRHQANKGWLLNLHLDSSMLIAIDGQHSQTINTSTWISSPSKRFHFLWDKNQLWFKTVWHLSARAVGNTKHPVALKPGFSGNHLILPSKL